MSKKVDRLSQIVPEVFPNMVRTYNGLLYDGNGNLITVLSQLSYKVYTCLLTQNATSDPTVVVLENTIGDIKWIRHSSGVYHAYLIDAFPENKTFYFSQATQNNTPDNVCVYMSRGNNDIISISTLWQGSGEIDGWLLNTPVEIRVYNT